MYVWAAFEAKSPPTRQDLVTLTHNNSLMKINLKRCDHFAAF